MTRAESSRINGAKSKGPTSTEGKARSSQNNFRHGLYAKTTGTLTTEDKEAFHHALLEYIRTFEPRTIPEAEWIVTMLNATWRLRRAEKDYNNLIDIEQMNSVNDWESSFSDITPDLRQTLGYEANIARRHHSIMMLDRTISSCTRIIARATTQIRNARKSVDPQNYLPLDEILQAIDLLEPENSRYEPENHHPQPEPPPSDSPNSSDDPGKFAAPTAEPTQRPIATPLSQPQIAPANALVPRFRRSHRIDVAYRLKRRVSWSAGGSIGSFHGRPTPKLPSRLLPRATSTPRRGSLPFGHSAPVCPASAESAE